VGALALPSAHVSQVVKEVGGDGEVTPDCKDLEDAPTEFCRYPGYLPQM
jgi:hypothetical protein